MMRMRTQEPHAAREQPESITVHVQHISIPADTSNPSPHTSRPTRSHLCHIYPVHDHISRTQHRTHTHDTSTSAQAVRQIGDAQQTRSAPALTAQIYQRSAATQDQRRASSRRLKNSQPQPIKGASHTAHRTITVAPQSHRRTSTQS